MATGWGTKHLNAFLEEKHHAPPANNLPSNVRLPTPFVVCIVGASRGIGAGIATSYAAAGASHLILSSRRTSGLDATAAACRAINPSINLSIIPTDITRADSVRSLAEQIQTLPEHRLDVVVLNSGYSGPVVLKVTDTDPETFERATATNYTGTFLCAKFLIPLILASPRQSNGAGRAFLVVSSWAAFIVRGPIANAQYCVSKAAQLKLAEHLHEEFGAEEEGGLNVVAVHPGAVASEMALETAPEAFKQYLTDDPELCGATCVWLTKDGEKKWLGGRIISALWDVDELVAKKEEVVTRDLLKSGVMC